MAMDVMPISGSPFIVAARLCNFPTGKATLLPQHKKWIRDELGRALTNSVSPWIDVIGYASKLGAAKANETLSGRRCDALKAEVGRIHRGSRFNVELHKGESESLGAEDNNDGYWRSVDVYAYGFQPPVPVRPPPTPSPAVGSTDFEIRVVGGGSGSLLIQTDDYFFQIVDTSRRLTAFFLYTGLGFGVSLPKIPGPGSVTKAGPPTAFRTSRPVMLHVFNSPASLYQDPGATGGSASIGGTLRLVLKDVKDYQGVVAILPTSRIPIEGGPGIQMPGLGSASEGVFALTSAVFPFTGY